ncbi:MAG TPA: hypothetical protein VE645_19195 [Pseudonocardiaceae bacterium]|jgi:hypothetical protein|nr:hypothetical protein [Pseudonocardiaceae bacterium]
MAYRTAAQTRFSGGLNLRDGSDVASPDQAIDVMNVTFLPAGGMRQRDGFTRFTSDALTNQPDSLSPHYESDGTRQLIVGNGNRLDVLNTSGASIANVATTAGPHYFARFAAPGSEHTLIANGTDEVRRWDGAAFSAPSYTGTAPTGRFLGVTAQDNRLIVARTAANPDRVVFSDPGLPTTFGANNYVDLHPGNGDPITAEVDWNDYSFVFKRNEFSYYYGTSTDADGEPVFNFRHVEGVGCVGAACAAPEGVYFLADSGVYRTTGGRPDLVSSMIDPLFLGGSSLFFTGGELEPSVLSSARLWWSQSRLYLAYATNATNDRLAVFSPRDGWWTLYDIPVAAMTSFRPGSREELVFAFASGGKHVGRYAEGSGATVDDAFTTDNQLLNADFAALTAWQQNHVTGSASVVSGRGREVAPGTNNDEGLFQEVAIGADLIGTTASFSVKVTSVAAPRAMRLVISCWDASDAIIEKVDSPTFIPTGVETLITATPMVVPLLTDHVFFVVATNAAGAATTFDLDDATATFTSAGAAISSHWRQGWVSYGSEDEKRIRQTKLWGSGSAQFGLSRNFEINPVRWEAITLSSSGDTWGDGTATDAWGDGTSSDQWGPTGTTRGWVMSMSCPGHVLGVMVRNSQRDLSWAIHRLEHGFAEFSRGPEVVGSGRTDP